MHRKRRREKRTVDGWPRRDEEVYGILFTSYIISSTLDVLLSPKYKALTNPDKPYLFTWSIKRLKIGVITKSQYESIFSAVLHEWAVLLKTR